jgi:hypothetical protein
MREYIADESVTLFTLTRPFTAKRRTSQRAISAEHAKAGGYSSMKIRAKHAKPIKRNRKRSLHRLTTAGTSIAIGVSAATASAITHNPYPVIVATGIVPMINALQDIGFDLENRILGPAEEVRIGAVMLYATDKLERELKRGRVIRGDDFFEGQHGKRPKAHEVVEGILQAARLDQEEKKVPFYGNLLANIALRDEIDLSQANLYIKLAERMSYRQLCILALFGYKGEHNLRETDFRGTPNNISMRLADLLVEILELCTQDLVSSGDAILGLTDIAAANMRVQGAGAALCQYMELHELPAEDIRDIAVLLE